MAELMNKDNYQKIIDFIKEKGFPTGSNYFGYKSKDIDYVILASEFETFCKSLNEIHLQPESYLLACKDNDVKKVQFQDIKLDYMDEKYDIICVDEDEFKVWYRTTKFFKGLIDKYNNLYFILENKENRVSFFNMLQVFYRDKSLVKNLKIAKRMVQE
jgi:hypothetical protein